MRGDNLKYFQHYYIFPFEAPLPAVLLPRLIEDGRSLSTADTRKLSGGFLPVLGTYHKYKLDETIIPRIT